MSETSNYPLPPGALRPSWTNRRSQLFGAAVVVGCLAAIALRMPVPLQRLSLLAIPVWRKQAARRMVQA